MVRVVLVIVLALAGCGAPAGICCEVPGGSCASGPTVTAEVCELELGGTVQAGECNDAGVCE